MTISITRNSSRLARRAVKQGASSAIVPKPPVVFEKSARGSNKLLKCKRRTLFSTFNVRTLQSINQLPELTANAEKYLIDIVCIQEHRIFHPDDNLKYHNAGKDWTLITSSAWKNTVNATIGGVGLLISPFAMKSLNSIENILPRMMIATFNGNPVTTVISCYSPTNVSDEEQVLTFYEQLSGLVRDIPKHNVLIIGGDFNAQIGNLNPINKTNYHDVTNRNGNLLQEFAVENELYIANINFQKRKGKLWTFQYPNGAKAQLDYMLINKKWKNSCINSEAYSSFAGVSSDHRIVTTSIRLSLRANRNISNKDPPFLWGALKDKDTQESYCIELKNRFELLKDEKEESPDITYKKFIEAHEEAAKLHIPLKPKIKKRVPWESADVMQKREEVRKHSKRKDTNPTLGNMEAFNKSKHDLKKAYEDELKNYILGKTELIKQSSENKKSSIAWQAVNEITGRKIVQQGKLKAASQKDRLQQWQDHFQNLLGKPPTVTDEQIQTIFDLQSDIKLGNFEEEELHQVLNKMKNGKAPGLDGIPPEVWKTKAFNDILLNLCNEVYNGKQIETWCTGCILPFPKKGDLSNTENYRGITLTSIAAKIYNSMLLNRIQPTMEKILRKNQNGFRKGRSATSQILTIRRIIEGVKNKNLTAALLFVDFSKAFDSINRTKMKKILEAYGIPDETVSAIMMLYKNTKACVRSPDGDTNIFEIFAGVLQGDTLAPYLFVICLDYVLRTSVDLHAELGFTLSKRRSRRYPPINITDADYADDLALLSGTVNGVSELLHSLEKSAADIGLFVNAKKTKLMQFNCDGAVKTKSNLPVETVNNFAYLGSNTESTATDVNIRIAKAWYALKKLSIIWNSNLTDEIKKGFFRAAVESVLLYGSSTWTLTKQLESKLNGNYTRMLRAVLNKSWRDHITNKELYGNLLPIVDVIRERRLRFIGHCWRSKEELISQTILWKPSHGYHSIGRPRKTYIDQLLTDIGLEYNDLPKLLDDRTSWKDMVKRVRAS